MAGGIHVIVDRLLAADHEAWLLFVDDCFQDLGDSQRFDIRVHIVGGHDQNRAVGPHGECGAQGFLRLLHADRDCDDFFDFARFTQADSLFDGDFVEGVHRHLYVSQIDTGTVRLDADLHVIVDHAFDRHQYLHRVSLPWFFKSCLLR